MNEIETVDVRVQSPIGSREIKDLTVPDIWYSNEVLAYVVFEKELVDYWKENRIVVSFHPVDDEYKRGSLFRLENGDELTVDAMQWGYGGEHNFNPEMAP